MHTISKRILHRSAAVCLGVVLWSAQTQGQQQLAALVIQGGTLIDGMGGAPIANSVVVIQGNRVIAAGRAGQVPIPAGAQIINANGKFVLPGLWDSQTNYAWFWGELMLNEGVTSTIDIGDGEEQSIAYRDAANHGKVVGPRALVGIGHMGGIRGGTILTGMETPLATRKDPKSTDDAKSIAGRFLAAGADMVMFHDGSYPAEFYQSAYDEAHKAGKPAFCRCSGPKTGPKEGALAGADVYPHSTGIGAAVAKDGTRSNNELDRYAAMDDAKAKELIDVLAAHHVNLVPTIVHDSPGYPKDWARFQSETEKVFSNPNLLAYYEPHYLKTMQQTYERAGRADQGDVRARRQQGYLNMLRFNKMYDAAGGRVLAGGDTNQGKAPGLILHDEMEAMQEAGIPRMHIIQGATEWPAEAMRVQNTIGSLTSGKIADVLIVNADPLQDIANLRSIDTVILDGKIVERGYHASYSIPFRGTADMDEKVSVVDRLAWTAALKQATFRPGQGGGGGNGQAGGEGPDPMESPQPAIESITPVMVAQGSSTVTLTVKGFNFVRRSRVYFDGESIPYKRVSATELQVTLDSNLLARAGRFDVVVKNPEPVSQQEWGNGASNKAHLLVTFRN
jgi:imidazolonepropionase-like amidohydrolase